jgi:hypothetical protein
MARTSCLPTLLDGTGAAATARRRPAIGLDFAEANVDAGSKQRCKEPLSPFFRLFFDIPARLDRLYGAVLSVRH